MAVSLEAFSVVINRNREANPVTEDIVVNHRMEALLLLGDTVATIRIMEGHPVTEGMVDSAAVVVGAGVDLRL